uniref:Uncharacterized protein n=1 Tax=Anopheles maculatus TaxID=74869 RepID=A0A182T6F0_9DIPT
MGSSVDESAAAGVVGSKVELHRQGSLVDELVEEAEASWEEVAHNSSAQFLRLCNSTAELLPQDSWEVGLVVLIHRSCNSTVGLLRPDSLVGASVEVLLEAVSVVVAHSSSGQFLHSYSSTVELHQQDSSVDESAVEEVVELVEVSVAVGRNSSVQFHHWCNSMAGLHRPGSLVDELVVEVEDALVVE